jgi:hypothetical protein
VRRLLDFDQFISLEDNIEVSCVDLLQAMELEGSEVDEMELTAGEIDEDPDKEEWMNLPNE